MIAISYHILQVDEHVRLKSDVPKFGLRCGEEGTVCSTWFSPTLTFEVEFQHPGESYPIRALLPEDQIELRDQIQSHV